MIRTVCLLLLLSAGDTLSAQQCICWRRDKVTQLIFPSEVVKFRAGYTSNDAVSQSDGPVLYIQPVDSLAESNLNVITADGCYYAFNVIYDSTAAMVNYIITPSMAFYRENTATHPATVGEQQPAETSAPTDGLDPKEQTPKDPLEIVGKKPDYIVANNIARLQKLVFMLKGVYVDEQNVYFKFRLENHSNVAFDVDYITFSITARKTKKASTQERVQLQPVRVDEPVHRLGAKSTCEVVYAFEKFTIGEEKILLAEVLELGGDRNIGLQIPESFIIEARKL